MNQCALGDEHDRILGHLRDLYVELFRHDGFGELSLEMRFLKKGQKEIIIHCGKDFRYVVDYPGARSSGQTALQDRDRMKGGQA